MSDTILSWDLGIDLSDFKRELSSVGPEIRKLDQSVSQFARELNKGFDSVVSEVRSLGQDLRSVLSPAFAGVGQSAKSGIGQASQATQQLKTESKAAAAEVRALGKATEAAFKSAARDVQALNREIRQVDMSPWAKKADTYGERIKAAQGHVAGLYLKLQAVTTTDAQRLKIIDDIDRTQMQIVKLQEAQNKASALAVRYAQQQAQSEKDRAEAIKQAEATRQANAAKNAADRAAATAQLQQQRQLLAEQRQQSRTATQLGSGIGRIDTGLQNQIGSASTAMRQSGMSESQRLADNYAVSLAKSNAQIDAMKQKLAGANIENSKRLQLEQQIAAAEQRIGELTLKSKQHVEQVTAAEKARLAAAQQAENEANSKSAMAAGRQAVNELGMMAGLASAALTAGLAGAAKEFGDLEAQLIKFGAVSGATSAEMKAIEDQALKLGASTKYTAQEIAAAQVELAKMGFTAKEVQDSMGFMVNAAIASGDSLDEVSATIAATIRMFNMAASDAGKVSDIITRGANISAQSFKSYADSMRYVGAAANGLEQPLETVATALNILADRGIKGTQAGEHLKIALQRLAVQPKPAAEAIDKLGLAIANTNGTIDKSDDTFRNLFDIIRQIKTEFDAKSYNSIEKTNFLKQLFGAEAVASMRVFIDASNETIDAAIAKQADYAGSTKETADKMKSGFSYAVEEMRGAINALQISIGKEAVPALTALANGVKDIVDAFSSLSQPMKEAGVEAGLFATGVLGSFAGAAGVIFVVGQTVGQFKALYLAVKASKIMQEAHAGAVAAHSAVLAGSTGFNATLAAGTAGTKAFMLALAPALGLFAALSAAVLLLVEHMKNLNAEMKAYEVIEAETMASLDIRNSTKGAADRVKAKMAAGQKVTPEELMAAAHELSQQSVRQRRRADQFSQNASDYDSTDALQEAMKKRAQLLQQSEDAKRQADAYRLTAQALKNIPDQLNNFGAALDGAADDIEAGAGSGGQSRIGKALDGILDSLDKDVQTIRDRATQRDTAITNAEDSVVSNTADGYDRLVAAAREWIKSGGADAFAKKDAEGLFAIGKACDYATEEMLRLGGVSDKVLAKFTTNVPATIKALRDAGMITEVSARDARSGDITTAANQSHIGLYTGNGNIIDARNSQGYKIGKGQRVVEDKQWMRGAKYYRINPQYMGSGSGAVASPSTDSAQQRMLNEKQAIEQEYAKQAAALARLKALRAQYSTDISKYSKEDQESLKELDKAIGKVAGELVKLENSAAKKKLDLSKAKTKAEQDEIKVQLKAAADQYGDLGEAGEKAINGLIEKAGELKQANEEALKSDQEIADEANKTRMESAAAAAAALKVQADGLDAAIKKFKGKKLDEENQKILDDLIQRREEIGQELINIAAGMIAFNEQAAESARLDAWADMAEQATEVFTESDAAFKKLLEGEEDLKKFANKIDDGSDSLEKMARRLGLTEEETKKLRQALLKLNNQEAVDKLAEDVAKAEQAFRSASDAASAMGSEIAQTLGAIGEGISKFNTDIGGAVSDLGAMFGTVKEGVISLADSIRSEDPAGMMMSLMQSAMAYWGFIGAQFDQFNQKTNQAIANIYRGQSAMRAANELALQQGIIDARARGEDVTGMEANLRNVRASNQKQDMVDAYNVKYGVNAAKLNPDGSVQFGKVNRAKIAEATADAEELKNAIITINQGLQEQITQTADKAAEATAEAVEKHAVDVVGFFKNAFGDPEVEKGAKDFLDKFAGNDQDLRQRMSGVANEFAQKAKDIRTSTEEAFGKIEFNPFGVPSVSAHLYLAQLTRLIPEFEGKVQDILDQAAGEILQRNANSLKNVREKAYKADVKAIEGLIKAEEKRLATIEKQNAAIQKQIQKEEDLLKKKQGQFEKLDTGKFAAAVGSVNYQAELRAGLDAIHNPEGVQTETYSGETQITALKERIDLLKMAAENKFALEQFDNASPEKNRQLYLEELQRIAAIQGRFAQEQMLGAEQGSRKWLELQAMQSDAYKAYKDSYLENLSNATNTEIEKLNASIEANNRRADTIQANIARHKTALDELSVQYQTDIDAIDTAINEVMGVQEAWVASMDAVKKGIQGPINEMIGMYRQLKNAAAAAVSAGAVLPSAPTADMSAFWAPKAKKMATGGVVPPGFEGDRFPALLNSGEPVFPKWFGDLLDRTYRMNMIGSTAPSSTSHSTVIHMRIDGSKDPLLVAREVGSELDRRGLGKMARVNGAYMQNTGMS